MNVTIDSASEQQIPAADTTSHVHTCAHIHLTHTLYFFLQRYLSGNDVIDIDTNPSDIHITHTSHTPHTHLTHTSHTPHAHLTHTSRTSHKPHTPHTHLTHTSHTSHAPHTHTHIDINITHRINGRLSVH